MPRAEYRSTRRAFLRATGSRATLEVRLPWLITERFLDHCTRCGECLDACPERVITKQGGGFPGIDFGRGKCTFCGACAGACPESLFAAIESEPWHLKARASEDCLANRGVMCRSCADACDEGALRFHLLPGGFAAPHLDPDLCTGCGACVPVCPVQAISIA